MLLKSIIFSCSNVQGLSRYKGMDKITSTALIWLGPLFLICKRSKKCSKTYRNCKKKKTKKKNITSKVCVTFSTCRPFSRLIVPFELSLFNKIHNKIMKPETINGCLRFLPQYFDIAKLSQSNVIHNGIIGVV